MSVDAATVAAVDDLIKQGRQYQRRNRSELVRLDIEWELARCQSDDFAINVSER